MSSKVGKVGFTLQRKIHENFILQRKLDFYVLKIFIPLPTSLHIFSCLWYIKLWKIQHFLETVSSKIFPKCWKSSKIYPNSPQDHHVLVWKFAAITHTCSASTGSGESLFSIFSALGLILINIKTISAVNDCFSNRPNLNQSGYVIGIITSCDHWVGAVSSFPPCLPRMSYQLMAETITRRLVFTSYFYHFVFIFNR